MTRRGRTGFGISGGGSQILGLSRKHSTFCKEERRRPKEDGNAFAFKMMENGSEQIRRNKRISKGPSGWATSICGFHPPTGNTSNKIHKIRCVSKTRLVTLIHILREDESNGQNVGCT